MNNQSSPRGRDAHEAEVASLVLGQNPAGDASGGFGRAMHAMMPITREGRKKKMKRKKKKRLKKKKKKKRNIQAASDPPGTDPAWPKRGGYKDALGTAG